MISKKQYEEYANYAYDYFKKANIVITDEERKRIEVADFNLNNLKEVGLQLLVYVNTSKVCAKEMVLLPYQTCPEHIHVNGVDKDNKPFEGKEETFRVKKGTCYLYIQGKGKKEDIKAKIPPTTVSVFHEIILHEGEQFTMYPNTKHWFQAGSEGAIISEFSTTSRDEYDVFTDKRIKRIPEIVE